VTLLGWVIVNSHPPGEQPLAEPVPDSDESSAPRFGAVLTLTLVPYGCGLVHAPNVLLCANSHSTLPRPVELTDNASGTRPDFASSVTASLTVTKHGEVVPIQ